MNREEILQIFRSTGALLSGHFLLTSGLHSDQYFQCARVLQYPKHAETLCARLAQPFLERRPDVVIAPAIGGIIVGYETARALGVRALFTEREQGDMTLRRGFELQSGERALLVEDVITTGGSLEEVLTLARNAGAEVVGAACLVDRSGGNVEFGVEFHALLSLQVRTYPPEQCPLCQRGEPLVKPGSRNLQNDA